ncbi:aldo/keto reductase [Ruegeria conchae]|uniref:Aryl-alcohol dehydrogenase-like predicted oxidoreductase n=1 Tax=Ruegeria conchae TaxID=981384 RepID=A0A497ZIR2_9RHOB|nr:aldo/keto reductase [Ruegeria conchae]RLK07158.1 aryl-alcohol dehydrogenase-like predicted oxidoreductase [Ruegeria conchae]
MNFLNTEISPLGMGCWPIGGKMYWGEQSLGYTRSDDETSIRTIHAALDGGITLFDTAAAYGAGHSERLLGKALRHRPDALIVTKIGVGIDEASRQISFDPFTPDQVGPAVEGCLSRLERDRIDLLLLHVNDMPIAQAEAVFDELDRLNEAGKLRAYGWSTDHSESARAASTRDGFEAVEYVLNVFFDAPRMQQVVQEEGLLSLIRSPLAMGLLSGKYNRNSVMAPNDVRASGESWMEYYSDGRVNPDFMQKLEAVRDLLTTNGRTLVQGALGWIWGQSETYVPIPGARTEEQIEGISGALTFGALPVEAMNEIESLISRNPNEPDRPR